MTDSVAQFKFVVFAPSSQGKLEVARIPAELSDSDICARSVQAQAGHSISLDTVAFMVVDMDSKQDAVTYARNHELKFIPADYLIDMRKCNPGISMDDIRTVYADVNSEAPDLLDNPLGADLQEQFKKMFGGDLKFD